MTHPRNRGQIPRQSRVLYALVRDTGYPRFARIHRHLTDRGFEVVIVNAVSDRRIPLLNLLTNARSVARAEGPFDLVLLAEFSSKYALLTYLLAVRHRAVHVVDGLVAQYETAVVDRRRVAARSAAALFLRVIDSIAARLAVVYLIDTEVRAKEVRRIAGRRTTVLALPMGAPVWARALAPRPPSDTLEVLFYGRVSPLHGLEHLLEGVRIASAYRRIHLTIVVSGWSAESEQQARAIAGTLLTVQSVVPEDQLLDYIARADVVAGVFGTSSKAASVIANKVWQALATGRPVLTRESAALIEIAPAVGAQLVTVPAGDADAIARSLVGEDWRSRVAGSEVAQALEHLTRERFRALDELIDLREVR